MLQHFVEFSKETETEGLWGTHRSTGTEVTVISGRDLEEVRLVKPESAYGFRFFDQNVVECEDGEVIRGEKKNYSGNHYFGTGPFSKEELLESEQGEQYKHDIELWEAIHASREIDKQWNENGWNSKEEGKEFPDFFVIVEDGSIYPLYPGDSIIVPRNDF